MLAALPGWLRCPAGCADQLAALIRWLRCPVRWQFSASPDRCQLRSVPVEIGASSRSVLVHQIGGGSEGNLKAHGQRLIP